MQSYKNRPDALFRHKQTHFVSCKNIWEAMHVLSNLNVIIFLYPLSIFLWLFKEVLECLKWLARSIDITGTFKLPKEMYVLTRGINFGISILK